MVTVNGKLKKGKVVLDEPLKLPDGTRVSVQVLDAQPNVDPFVWLMQNAVNFGVDDLADEHDHYIYGTPKRKKRKSS